MKGVNMTDINDLIGNTVKQIDATVTRKRTFATADETITRLKHFCEDHLVGDDYHQLLHIVECLEADVRSLAESTGYRRGH